MLNFFKQSLNLYQKYLYIICTKYNTTKYDATKLCLNVPKILYKSNNPFKFCFLTQKAP